MADRFISRNATDWPNTCYKHISRAKTVMADRFSSRNEKDSSEMNAVSHEPTFLGEVGHPQSKERAARSWLQRTFEWTIGDVKMHVLRLR
jgi:hypothetical protein